MYVWAGIVAVGNYIASAYSAVAAGTATAAQLATVAAVSTTVSVGIGAATAPSLPSQGANVEWTADPDAPMHFALGRIGVAGNIIDAGVFGTNDMYVSFVVECGSAGPIKGFESFKADDNVVTIGAGTAVTSEPFAGEMWVARTRGLQPDVAMSMPTGLQDGSTWSQWGSGRRLSGTYGYLVTMAENSKGSAYTGKIPSFMNVIEGLFCYDPRYDSTYPGGSGTCRLNDASTWVYSQNPIIHGLKWALGLWEGPTLKGAPAHGSTTDFQVGGVGAKVENILVSTFVEAANIADANGWTSAAWPSTDDDKIEVLRKFLETGGASYAEINGMMACIHRATPRAPVFAITGADTAGPVEIDATSSRLNRINTIRPRFLSEANDWRMTAVTEVTRSTWKLEDGQGIPVTRTRGMDYDFCDQSVQARTLAALDIAHSREPIRGKVPLRIYTNPQPGDCFIFDEPDFELADVKCIVTSVEDDTDNDRLVVSFESETDEFYTWAYSQTGATPPTPPSIASDPRLVAAPAPGDWTVEPQPAGLNGQVPGFFLVGESSNATITGIRVEIGITALGPWRETYVGLPTAERIPITGIQPGQDYYVAVSNVRGSNTSARRVYGPVTGPDSVSGSFIGQGDLAVLDEADTPQITPNAVTNQLSAYTSATQTLTGTTNKTIQTLTFTTTGGRLKIGANFFMSIWHPTAGGIDAWIRIVRSSPFGGNYFDQTISAIGGDFISGWQTPTVTANLAAGTYTFDVVISLSNNDASVQTVQSALLTIEEFKR
ncbi:hypothetical protein [Brevundimonas sp. FT23028]|uniref:hypothetical protein n=1 Tax=Brevundimonas sp. FT23028 TaxID=3393748 RepID=UPI003B58A9AD